MGYGNFSPCYNIFGKNMTRFSNKSPWSSLYREIFLPNSIPFEMKIHFIFKRDQVLVETVKLRIRDFSNRRRDHGKFLATKTLPEYVKKICFSILN
jgi:hypothetical protein